jgi:L-iditol 2-dehydrogenase
MLYGKMPGDSPELENLQDCLYIERGKERSMRAIVYEGVGKITLKEMPKPKPRRGSVVVRVHTCAICGTDVKAYNIGIASIKPPVVLGHEFVGDIVETDSSVKGFQPGDRVSLATTLPCGNCRMCKRELFNLCLDKEPVGTFIDGAFAEYLEIPARGVFHGNIVPVPETLSDAEACLCEPLGCVINSQNLARVGFPDNVVVIGAGPLGILQAETAKARGCSMTILVQRSRKRYERAKQFNIDHVICTEDEDPLDAVMSLTDGAGADMVINAAPSREAVELAFKLVGKSGKVSLFASVPKDNPLVGINVNRIHYEQIEVYGASDLKPSNALQAMNLLESGAISTDRLITHVVELEDFFKAVELINRREALKVVIRVTEE